MRPRSCPRFSRPVLLFAVCLATAGPALADIRVSISFTFIEDEVAPRPGEHRRAASISYVLRGKTVQNTSNSGRRTDLQIGAEQDMTNEAGVTYRAKTRIEGGAFLMRQDYPSFFISTRITTNGVDSCSATREAVLKPGHRIFEDRRTSNGETMQISSIRYEDVTCTISN